MKWIYFLYIVGHISMETTLANTSNFTLTYSMAMKCKEHISKHGYSYEMFYRLDDTSHKQTMLKEASNGNYLEMHIAIQAASNGHILLSPVPKPGANDPVYEIVVGGGGNRFTEIRRNLKRNARSSAKTPGILSTIEFRAFYIKISSDGLLEFGKEGDILPVLSYYDLYPLQINYFSFASWTGVEAKYLYDCPAPGDYETKPSPDSQAVEPQLSNSDELKRTLLMARMPSVPPGPTVSVRIGIIITNVRYDALEAKLVTRMAVVTSWTDDSMAWNPGKFNGTTSINLRPGQIWRPTFFVYNSDNIGTFDTKNPDLISMVYSGEATFHFQTEVTTLCHDESNGLSKWPHDEYSCIIIIEPWEVHEKISLQFMDANDIKMKTFTGIDEFVQSEWDVTVDQMVVKPIVWEMVYTSDNQTHQSDRLMINFELNRHATSYNIVFYTPLLVLTTFVLVTFWSEPLKMSRIWFYTGCTIVVCMGLCNIDYLIPTHTVPSILVLYTTVLAGILIALIIHVILMTSMAEILCKGAIMQALLTARLLRKIFCLPEMKISINGSYATQEDEDSILNSPSSSNVEEMESEEEKTYGDKAELAEVIDKIMFFVYSITFAVMLATHF